MQACTKAAPAVLESVIPSLSAVLFLGLFLGPLVGCRALDGQCSGDAGKLCVQVVQAGASPVADALKIHGSAGTLTLDDTLSSGVADAFSRRGRFTLDIDLTPVRGSPSVDLQFTAQKGGADLSAAAVTWHPSDGLTLVVNLAFPGGDDMGATPDLSGGDDMGPAPDLSPPGDAAPTPPWQNGQLTLPLTLGGSFSRPADVCWNGTYLFVSDSGNSRVLFYKNPFPTIEAGGNPLPTGVIGRPDLATTGTPLSPPTAASVNTPVGISCDGISLLIADSQNHRVLFYDLTRYPADIPNGIPADGVIGQATFVDAMPNRNLGTVIANGLHEPHGVLWDTASANKRVYIADTFSNRAVGYDAVNAAQVKVLGGRSPSVIFGQADYTHGGTGMGPSGVNLPESVGVNGGKLALVDSGNNRVLLFNIPMAALLAGPPADAVLGQTSLVNNGNGTAAAEMFAPATCRAVAEETFVTDRANNRVLIFEQGLATAMTGASAQFVLGQPSFGPNTAGFGRAGMRSPSGTTLAMVNGKTYLLVADSGNARVQIFQRQ